MSVSFARLVWPLSCVQLLSWGSVYYSFALFMVPMEQELGWSRAEITAGLTIGLVSSGVASLITGRLVDRGYGRAVMTAGSLMAALLLLAWSRVETLGSFHALWLGLGVAMGAILYEPAFAVLVRTLGARSQRGIAHMTLIGGFASTLFVPICHVLIETYGWRDALVVLALGNALGGATLHYITLSSAGAGRATATAVASDARARGWLPGRSFFWFAAAFTAATFVTTAAVFHAVPMVVEYGHPAVIAVAALAAFGPSQVVGRVLVSLVFPKLSLPAAGCIALGVPALGLLLVIAGVRAAEGFVLLGICLGFGNGIATIVRAGAVAALAGSVGFGSLQGAMNIPVSMARAFGPAAASLVWSVSGDYDLLLRALAGVSVLSVLCFLIALRR